MIDFNVIFLNNNQPMTCPICSARTDFGEQKSPIDGKIVEIHKCLSIKCQFIFVAEHDKDFENELDS